VQERLDTGRQIQSSLRAWNGALMVHFTAGSCGNNPSAASFVDLSFSDGQSWRADV
jgi:hypothetical protein